VALGPWLCLLVLASGVLWARERPVRVGDGETHSPHGKLDIACDNCHTAKAWSPIRPVPEFDHRKTGFALRGMHVKVACKDCHTDLVFSHAGRQCQDCHADLHRRRNGAQCDICHRDTGWQVSIHNINEHQDRFPLIGAHAAVDCYSCHKVGTVGAFNRQGLSTDCSSCHMDDFKKTKSPNHLAEGYPTECLECHSLMDNWMTTVSPAMVQRARRRR
jgi:ribosomal protein S27E